MVSLLSRCAMVAILLFAAFYASTSLASDSDTSHYKEHGAVALTGHSEASLEPTGRVEQQARQHTSGSNKQSTEALSLILLGVGMIAFGGLLRGRVKAARPHKKIKVDNADFKIVPHQI